MTRRLRTRCLLRTACLLALVGLSAQSCALRSPCDTADLRPIEGVAYAVGRSDYISSAVALLDHEGEALSEAWVDSGSVAPGLVAPLSGDIVIPADSLLPGVLTLIDRYNADTLALLWLDGSRTLQIDMRGDPTGDYALGYSANPQDALRVDDRLAIVSRLNPNLDPAAPPLAQGNDLALVDLAVGRVVDRITLDADEAITVDTARGPRSDTAFARPSGLAWFDPPAAPSRRFVVGLARLTGSFQDAAPGMVALVNLETRETTLLRVPELTNCAHVDAPPGHWGQVIVLCQGATFTLDDEGRRPGAGAALVEQDELGVPRARVLWRAIDHPDAPVPSDGLIALPGHRLVANARGSTAGLEDRLVYLDLDSAASTTLARSTEAFSFGVGVLSDDGAFIRVPDAAIRGIHRLRVPPDGVPSMDAVETIAGCRHLPPRALGRL